MLVRNATLVVGSVLTLAFSVSGCGAASSPSRVAAQVATMERTPPDTTVTDPEAQREAESMAQGFRGAYLVAREGKVLAAGAHGLADQVSGEENALTTSFRLASVSKPLTAIAIMQLHEAGKLDVMDPVKKHLPD